MNTNSKHQVWDIIADALTLRQYCKVVDNAPDRKYDTRFERTMSVTKNKRLLALCELGLGRPLETIRTEDLWMFQGGVR